MSFVYQCIVICLLHINSIFYCMFNGKNGLGDVAIGIAFSSLEDSTYLTPSERYENGQS